MITYEQYATNYAVSLGTTFEHLFRKGLTGEMLEEFTKGYSQLAIEAQKEHDDNSPVFSESTLIKLI